MNRPIVKVSDVSKMFRTTRAVDGVSLEIREGEIYALLGPNGAGKSTLVRMMIDMLPPDHGAIQWFGSDGNPIKMDPTQIGYLPEDRGLYRDQKVGRILEYFGQLRGMSLRQARNAAEAWASRLEISQYLPQKLETLSKGNQQKVQVAAAVLHRPRLVFLDEPFSGLDPLNQEMIVGVIRSLREEGTTVMLSAHQLDLVERLADRVLLLARGKQVIAGTIPQVQSSEFGGYYLRVQFDEPISRDQIQAWYNDPTVVAIECANPSGLQLTLNRRSDLNKWLMRAWELGNVTHIRGGHLSLHEIYLRAVGTDAESTGLQLASA